MEIIEKLLTPNPYSRPQGLRKKTTNIVIHWVANPGTSALANRNYFENLKRGNIYASAHYIIGLEGEVIRCIPEGEIAYHAKQANAYSIGIENCHPDWNGKFNAKTYESLIELCAMLCKKYNLDPRIALLRHYDVTKKRCPKYYIDSPEAWQQIKQDVYLRLQKDLSLYEAVQGLIAFGVRLDINVWGNMDTMNMKYAAIMVERIGERLGVKGYEATIDLLVKEGCINTRAIWDSKNFLPKWCRALLIKAYHQLCMPNK